MREIIREAVKDSTTLTEVKDSLLKVLRELRDQGHTRIGYLSGVDFNGTPGIIERLKRYVENSRREFHFSIFSAADVFPDNLPRYLVESKNEEWKNFRKEILEAGLITDILLIPRWDKSSEAIEDFNVGLKTDLGFIYILQELYVKK